MPIVGIKLDLNGDAAWVDIKDRIIEADYDELIRVATLDKGMKSGAPSVMIAIKMPDGKWVMGQVSVRVFQQAAAAMVGKYGYV